MFISKRALGHTELRGRRAEGPVKRISLNVNSSGALAVRDQLCMIIPDVPVHILWSSICMEA